MPHKTTASQHKGSPGVLPMFVIGAGLLVLGVTAFFALPKPSLNSSSNSSEFSAMPVKVQKHPAPDIALTRLDGSPVALTDFAGQVVLVNNWATWCPPCKAEMPTLQAYFDDHKDQGFNLVAIEAGDPAEGVKKFVNEKGLTFDVWLDPEYSALEAVHNDALPNSFVIDRQGDVVLVWTGAISRAMLDKYVNPLLEE